MKTALLTPDMRDEAVAVLRSGGLVALPTETVYGLAARADDETAVQNIFAAKNRPAINPLIIHVASVEMAARYAEFPPLAQKLAEAFWPGALTLVLPRKTNALLAPSVYAGLDTIAVRFPAHPCMQSIIHALDTPLAAPSANRSGRLSPTKAAHVLRDMENVIYAVLDGGETVAGLESSVVEPRDDKAFLLRHGALPFEEIQTALSAGIPLLDKTTPRADETIRSPGQLLRHYAPETALVLNSVEGDLILDFGNQAEERAALDLSPSGNLNDAAHHLFAYLDTLDRHAKARGIKEIHVAPIPQTGIGRAINDRLSRAAKSVVKDL